MFLRVFALSGALLETLSCTLWLLSKVEASDFVFKVEVDISHMFLMIMSVLLVTDASELSELFYQNCMAAITRVLKSSNSRLRLRH